MDPISTAALSAAIAGLLKPVTDAASSQMLTALKALARRIPGYQEGEVAHDLENLETGGTADASALANALISAAREDSSLEHDLRAWLTEVGSISNVNSGPIGRSLVQGRDFSGPININ